MRGVLLVGVFPGFPHRSIAKPIQEEKIFTPYSAMWEEI
jgi:hypothetical protein